jgi:hypothetical protein
MAKKSLFKADDFFQKRLLTVLMRDTEQLKGCPFVAS